MENNSKSDLFAVVYLIENKINVVIPIKWILSFDAVSMANDGLNSFKKHTIFYSNNKSDCADFTNACHQAYMCKIFG